METKKKYFINGIPATKIARQNGISQPTFQSRIRLGYSVERAATKPINAPKYGWVVYNKSTKRRIMLKSASEVAKYIGTSKNSIIGMHYRHNGEFKLGDFTIKSKLKGAQ